MSSILTNTSAMVALQNLQSTQKNLQMVNNQISTGKQVAVAKDNAAVWAISTTMNADVKSFNALSSGLSLGASKVATAETAAEHVTELLTQMKAKIVSAQNGTDSDKAKIQADIASLKGQIATTVSTAQFNGTNLIDGSIESAGGNGIKVLSSLNRTSDGTVSPQSISVDSKNLSLNAGLSLTAGSAYTVTDPGTVGVLDASDGGTNDNVTFNAFALQGTGGALAVTDASAVPTDATGMIAGDAVSLTLGNVKASYVVQAGDTGAAIAAGLKNSLLAAGVNSSDFTLDISTDGTLKLSNTTNKGVNFTFSATRGAGGLAGLGAIDVTSDAAGALSSIDGLIQTATDASAAFGTVANQISGQQDFLGKLTDTLTTGIGSLTDADMEAASARLQALQVQQQLGTQALSIANQSPQSILALFR